MIDNFKSEINIQSDGKVQVLETIDADFGELDKHGIFRDIPYIYQLGNSQNYYIDILLLGVLQNNVPAIYESSTSGDFLHIKIGDPRQTVSGKVSYQIQYLVRGALRSFSDHDELYWDVTGDQWPVFINKASAQVTLPQNAITGITCFEGRFGVNNKCRSNLLSASQASFQARNPLLPSWGLTVVVGYKKGSIPITTLTQSPKISSQNYNPEQGKAVLTMLIVAGVFFLLGGGTIFAYWFYHGREVGKNLPLVAEYFPPEKLKPAQVGTLVDEKADSLDVTATIVDLAARGFLTITEEPKKGLLSRGDYTLTRTKKEITGLVNYEKILLQSLFKEKEEILLSDLQNKFYKDLVLVKDALYKDMIDKKYFPTNPEKLRNKYTGFGSILFFLGVILAPSAAAFEEGGYWPGFILGIFFIGIILMIFSRSFPRRTTAGYQLFRRVLGFRMFIEKAEKYKQQFMERENIFNEVLPYAIVFGLTEKFAKVFEEMGIKPTQPAWYYGTGRFNPVIFSSNISNFSSSMSSAIMASPRSGFAGGGGFSGGGFGGGGGGSW